MISKKTDAMILGVALAAASAILTGCVKPPPEQPRVEQPTTPEALLPPAPPSVPETANPARKLPPPTEAEVRAAIARVYKDVVVVEQGRFVVGDFNGDGSQDVAVVVAPAMGMLREINSEVANWILEDPQKIVLPNTTKAAQRLAPVPAPAKVTSTDLLLAVLHGHGPSGWRNPESRQTYLLKNAAGNNLKTQQPGSIPNTLAGDAKFPHLRGDVVNETIGDQLGFLYYNGSKYVWFPIKPRPRAIASR